MKASIVLGGMAALALGLAGAAEAQTMQSSTSHVSPNGTLHTKTTTMHPNGTTTVDRTAVRPDGTVREKVAVHHDNMGWHRNNRYKVCRWEWRHHHKIRKCDWRYRHR